MNILSWTQIEERHNDYGASIVLGNWWGDEWKGKVTDILVQHSDVNVRFQWWHNAGHTLKVGDIEFDLHILPSGVVTPWTINIIASTCVLWIDLHKVDLEKIQVKDGRVICNSTLDEIYKRSSWKKVKVWLIPEIKKLEEKWVDIQQSGLKIGSEVGIIGMINVLLDAYDEKSRECSGLRAIGSTGSWISRAYASEVQRLHFSLNDLLLNNGNLFYDSIRSLWLAYKDIFPNISTDDLINSAKQERAQIVHYIQKWYIEVLENEQDDIWDLHNSWKKIVWEWAQSSMIGMWNSIYGTASTPSLQTFKSATWLQNDAVWNIFLVNKMPPSSVWVRPWFLKYPPSKALHDYVEKYNEKGVSTWRHRDLFHYSLPEMARWAKLNTSWIDDEKKIVTVFNRVDGIEEAIKLGSKEVIEYVSWYRYKVNSLIGREERFVWVEKKDIITPKTLLRNYPSKSVQSWMFDSSDTHLCLQELSWSIEQQIQDLLELHLSAVYSDDSTWEYLIWTWPSRDDLELRSWTPKRFI